MKKVERLSEPPEFDTLLGAARRTADRVIEEQHHELEDEARFRHATTTHLDRHYPEASGDPELRVATGTGRTFLYVLRLVEDKYYVGRTEDVTARLERHRRGGATNWTTRFPPLPGPEALYFWKPLRRDEEEDVVVEGLMFERYKRHGFDVVRGGTFFHPILPEHRRRALVDKFRLRDERCFVCGDECHVSKNCPARRRAVAQWREEVERAKRAVEDPKPRMPWESDEDEDEETPGDAATRRATMRANAYKRWTREEEERLVREVRTGFPTERRLARRHGRTERSIRERMRQLTRIL